MRIIDYFTLISCIQPNFIICIHLIAGTRMHSVNVYHLREHEKPFTEIYMGVKRV